MEILKQFKEYTFKELLNIIPKYKDYSKFNTLGLYRSIIENPNISVEEKVQLRELAHKYFQKAFDFLQLKDPNTYFKVLTLGESYTKGDEDNFWGQIKANQKKF